MQGVLQGYIEALLHTTFDGAHAEVVRSVHDVWQCVNSLAQELHEPLFVCTGKQVLK
jgi:hypothetical protein